VAIVIPPKHWKKEDLLTATAADNFYRLVPIAFDVIDRGGSDAMVCGPMTNGGLGDLRANYREFRRARKRLVSESKRVFDQLPFEAHLNRIAKLPRCPEEDQLLTGFYLPVFTSGKLKVFYFLPDWQTSYGAKWEHEQARILRIDIAYL
jgi:hypothetical protein